MILGRSLQLPFRNPTKRSKKRFWGDFFNFQEKFQNPFFPSEILQKVRKNDFWAIFSLFSKFSKAHFFPSEILQKVWKNDFGAIFSIFSKFSKVHFFPSEILQKVRKNDFWAIFSIFSKFSKVHFFPSGILQKLLNYYLKGSFHFWIIFLNPFFLVEILYKTWKGDFQPNFCSIGLLLASYGNFWIKNFLDVAF